MALILKLVRAPKLVTLGLLYFFSVLMWLFMLRMSMLAKGFFYEVEPEPIAQTLTRAVLNVASMALFEAIASAFNEIWSHVERYRARQTELRDPSIAIQRIENTSEEEKKLLFLKILFSGQSHGSVIINNIEGQSVSTSARRELLRRNSTSGQ